MARKSRKNLEQTELETPKMIIFATWGYARISVDKERSEDSIENQSAIIRDYIGDKADLDLRGVITDLGFTGRNFDRPGYMELMDALKRGEVGCIIVKDLSRLGRTYIEVGELLFDIFPAYGVRFISVNDNYDSFADDAGRKKLLILFKNLVNHVYSKDLGVKIKSSFVLKQQKGELLGSLPPYGYVFTKEGGGKRLDVEPESAEVVRLMFEMRARGDSMIKIAAHLNQNGILAPRNHYHHLGVLTSERDAKKALWQNGYIGNLLRNEVYIGKQIQGKYDRNGRTVTEKPREEWVIHENAHPAIVDRGLFDTVQRLLDESGEKYKKLGNALDENILVGKIFCSRCGKSLKRQHSRNKKDPTIVRYSYHCRDCCTELRHTLNLETIPQFHIDALSATITAVIQKQIDFSVNLDALVGDMAKSVAIIQKRDNLTAELKRFKNNSKKAEDMLASAYTHHLAGLLDSNEFDMARRMFERDKQLAESGAERVTQELNSYDLEVIRHNAFLANFRHFKGFTELGRGIVTALIDRIEVTPITKEINISLNFADELKELNRLVEESEVLSDVC